MRFATHEAHTIPAGCKYVRLLATTQCHVKVNGKAAKPVIPALRKVIENFNRDTERGDFPPSLNLVRVGAIEETIRAIETATTQPELRSIKR